jgi:hypothetical protein
MGANQGVLEVIDGVHRSLPVTVKTVPDLRF